ncbi:hypothetical protein IRZ71_01065 [Flavobacterium sp. ANB]|uniref:hypothetical protein n=1 Tax=unclassified Flavobacterium TaxID=196869 RepID=UPI0012B7654A|nr:MULTISPECIES: hypothetical protein [unclassified Flavobacterium]MBF4514913.1 hypothetical protein [Flavobacterium sp. ANB]MTD68239.1 hypothetical protein [Flavobacterium sp. LC2016-13]
MLIAIHTFAIAQNRLPNKNEIISKSTNESIFVHLNNTTLIVGETLHCKLYSLNPVNNTFSKISKIAYVDLVNNENQIIFTNKIYLDNGRGQGNFFIPTTIETGSYKLIVYTNWMLNKIDNKVNTTDLLLINPYIVNKKATSSKDSRSQKSQAETLGNNSVAENSDKDNGFAIEINKRTFQEREQVSLKIKSFISKDFKGSYSISVKKIDDLPFKKQMTASEFVKFKSTNELTNALKDSILFLPELRGEIISGTIINNKDPKQVAGKNIALSLPGKDFAFKIAKTNQFGRFNFILDKDPNFTNAIFQVFENDKNDYKIEIDNNRGYNKLSELKIADELNLTADYKNSIEQRSIANQIENAYYSLKKDSIPTNSKAIPFYQPLSKEYILSDYTKFPSLKETITEVLKEVYYREKDNNYSLGVRDVNYDMNYFSEPALVLVDGLLIQNVNELFNYKTENIYKVNIVPGIYFYGPKAFNGIINFTTKNNDYITSAKGDYILKTEIQRPQNTISAFKQDYTDKEKYDRIPDYRYQLLWQPEVSLENPETTITFFTSGVSGTFEINLEGFTNEGIPVSLRETFEVKDSTAN